jgi:glycogen debranching enzyme
MLSTPVSLRKDYTAPLSSASSLGLAQPYFGSQNQGVSTFPHNPSHLKFGIASASDAAHLGLQKKPPSPALEWIETAGDGSYASSTIGGANTRRYHGLLVGSLFPPVNRKVLLSRVDESVKLKNGNQYLLTGSLFKNQDLDKLKQSSVLLQSFSAYPIATWIYNLPENKGQFQKQIVFRKDQGTMVMGYTLTPGASEPVELLIRPFVNNRDFHQLSEEKLPWVQDVQEQGILLKSNIPGQPVSPLFIQWKSSQPQGAKIIYEKNEDWYNNYFYQREADRGLETTEHNFTPGELKVVIRPGETFSITSSFFPIAAGGLNINEVANERAKHLNKILSDTGLPTTETNRLLVRASDQFMVQRRSLNGRTILAGYHWFNDWGRDTMIALPGLAIATKRFEEAEGILNNFAKLAKNGIVPNRFPDHPDQQLSYNKVDTSLWWFNAVNAYQKAVMNSPSVEQNKKKASYFFLKGQYEALQKVVTHHLYGRQSGQDLVQNNSALSVLVDIQSPKLPVGDGDYGIGMDSDGLIAVDDPKLTWMDASSGNEVFTPRSGKPVEINALWYNSLKVMANLAKELQSFQKKYNPENIPGERQRQQEYQYTLEIGKYEGLARMVKDSMQKFWNPDKQCLFDLIDSPHLMAKAQVRPNQVMALSLPYRAFHNTQELSILRTIDEQLLTPYGLRTLSPQDHAYVPFYPNKGPYERDKAYHQGTVFSWLMGPYLDAYTNVHGNTERTRQMCREKLQPLLDHLNGKILHQADSGATIGGIAEIFDGADPHHSKGAVSQAASVGEVLRHQIALSQTV